jgi:hypothetical protein
MDMTREEAFQTLGLGNDASEYEIERRYTVLARRYRLENPDEQRDARINEAYNLLTGRDVASIDELVPVKLRRKVLGRTLYDWKNKWYYMRWSLLGILVLAGILGSILYSVLTTEKRDFQLAVVGQFALLQQDMYADDFPLNQFVRTHANAANPLLEFLPLAEEDASQMDIAVRMQMAIIVSGANPVDLFIVNDYTYTFYSTSGLFAPLDALYERLPEIAGEELASQIEPLYGTVMDADGQPVGAPYLMGLDFTGTWLVEGLGVNSGRNILCIGAQGEFQDKAEAMILAMCENREELAERGRTLHEQLQEMYDSMKPDTTGITESTKTA